MFLIVQTADVDGLGRFEKCMLTDQDRMNLFFTPEKPADAWRELAGDEADACSWVGITCDAENITHIEWSSSDLDLVGSINFDVLPPKLLELSLYDQKLVGEMNVSNLPETLNIFCVESCLFTGSLDFSTLPRGLQQLFITGNRIQSVANISNLPESLRIFQIMEKDLQSDVVEVGKLPDTTLQVKLRCMNARVKVLYKVDQKRVIRYSYA